MVIWFSSIDESGIDGHCQFAVVSAVIGRSDSWPPIYKNWKEVLDDFHIPYFHSTDFNCGTGIAEDLSQARRVDCVKRLIKTISDVKLEYITYALSHDTFRQVMKNHELSHLSIYDYLLATTICHLCVQMNYYQSQTEEPTEGVLVIEEGCSLDATISNGLMKCATRRQLGVLTNISYFPKREIPCQVADMIAYDSFKVIDGGEVDVNSQSITINQRKSFEKIIKGNPFRPFVINGSWLQTDLPAVTDFLERLSDPKSRR